MGAPPVPLQLMVWTRCPVLAPCSGSQPRPPSGMHPVCLPFLPSFRLCAVPPFPPPHSFSTCCPPLCFWSVSAILSASVRLCVCPPLSVSGSVSLSLSVSPLCESLCFLPPFLHICQPLLLPLPHTFLFFFSHSPRSIRLSLSACPSSEPTLADSLSPPVRLSLPCWASSVSPAPCLSLPLLSGKAGDLRAADRASCGRGRP